MCNPICWKEETLDGCLIQKFAGGDSQLCGDLIETLLKVEAFWKSIHPGNSIWILRMIDAWKRTLFFQL